MVPIIKESTRGAIWLARNLINRNESEARELETALGKLADYNRRIAAICRGRGGEEARG